MPELIKDQRFLENSDRVRNREQLLKLIEQVTTQEPKDHWIRLLEKAKVPCGPINNIKEAFEEEQARHRKMVWSIKNSEGDSVPSIGNPLHFGENSFMQDEASHAAPPKLGEHTEAVLRKIIAATDDEINKWKNESVI